MSWRWSHFNILHAVLDHHHTEFMLAIIYEEKHGHVTWPWSTMVDMVTYLTWPWSTLIYRRRPWLTVIDHGQPWSNMVDHGQMQLDHGHHHSIGRSTMNYHGRPSNTVVTMVDQGHHFAWIISISRKYLIWEWQTTFINYSTVPCNELLVEPSLVLSRDGQGRNKRTVCDNCLQSANTSN